MKLKTIVFGLLLLAGSVESQRKPRPSESRAVEVIVAVLLELKNCRVSETLLPGGKGPLNAKCW